MASLSNAPMACDHSPRPCAGCGTIFTPYQGGHLYCSDTCGKLARRLAGGQAAPQRRHAGLCRHCGRDIWVPDAHERTYCSRRCQDAAAEHREAPPDPPEAIPPAPVYTSRVLPDGTEVEVVWHGAVVVAGRRGALLELVASRRDLTLPWAQWDAETRRVRSERGQAGALRRHLTLAEQRVRVRAPGTRR